MCLWNMQTSIQRLLYAACFSFLTCTILGNLVACSGLESDPLDNRGDRLDVGTSNTNNDGGVARIDTSVLANDSATPSAQSCGVGSASIGNAWILYAARVALNQDIYAVYPDRREVVRLTSNAADESAPTVSPDGKRMAFASNASGVNQIYVADLSSKVVTRMTNLPGGATDPAWSLNGSQLAFTGLSGAFNSDRGTYLVNLDQPGAIHEIPYPAQLGSRNYTNAVFVSDAQLLLTSWEGIQLADLKGQILRTVVDMSTGGAWNAALLNDRQFLVYQCGGSVFGGPVGVKTQGCSGSPLVSGGVSPHIGANDRLVTIVGDDIQIGCIDGKLTSLNLGLGNVIDTRWAPVGTTLPDGVVW